MKYFLLAILTLLSVQVYGQDFDLPIDKNTGKYSVVEVYNFYNTTEDVVARVAKKFLADRKDIISKPVLDSVNKRYVSRNKWHFNGCAGCCTRTMDFDVEISIYYKDNKTKIKYTNFNIIGGDSDCPATGTLEEFVTCKNCKTQKKIAEFLRERYRLVNKQYKEHLVYWSRKKLF